MPASVKSHLDALEEATLVRAPCSKTEGKKRWRSLSNTEQWGVVEEIVATRAAELCQLFKDVVSVSPGNRVRRLKKTTSSATGSVASERTRAMAQPCVVFFVRRKGTWNRKQPPKGVRAVPEGLWAFCTVVDHDGEQPRLERKPCFVQTDVRDARELARVTAEDGTGVTVDSPASGNVELGAVACAVKYRVKGSTTKRLGLMSCRHVYSVTNVNGFGRPTRRLDVSASGVRRAREFHDAQKSCARTSGVAGRLSGSGLSHDVQIAQVRNAEQVQHAVRFLRLRFGDGYARSSGRVPRSSQYFILTPRKIITARYSRTVEKHEPAVGYLEGGALAFFARHSSLIESHTDVPTKGGDSGSPVVTERDGGMLLGMHIGGNKVNLSYMIPSWELFNTGRYLGGLEWIELEEVLSESDLPSSSS